MKLADLSRWVLVQKKKNLMKSSKINIADIVNWKIGNKKIYNYNRSFFSIVPFRFEQNKNKFWFQPLIVQKEVGILGIIKKVHKSIDYYLLQAKVEPGNVKGIQLSPTVQATKSNYLQKHGGKKTKYLNFFINNKLNTKIITNLRLSEQGTRYYDKSNNNILIDLKNKKIKKLNNFIWVTKKNLEYLLKKKNLLNMDTISVLSSSIQKNILDTPINNSSSIIDILKDLKKRIQIKKKVISFKDLKNWRIFKNKISDNKKNFFSIFFLRIKTNSREVKEWYQPIISDHSISFNGLLIKKKNNTNHYLLKAVQEPGLVLPRFTTTISIKNFNYKTRNSNIRFYNFFKNQKDIIKYVNSDEGGRFYKNETHNLIRVLKENDKVFLTKNFIWVSHNQIIDLIKRDLLTIEARNLFASFNIDKVI
jgi:oxidase EvaA